ncbi:MAG: dihydrodipicolinate reductase [Gemmatimonadetes bacterium]|nr:dihydrodipicolinate reductase [Gemmatimonadota bacterium]
MSALRIALIGSGRMSRAVRGLAPERGIEVVTIIGSHDNQDGRAITPGRLAGAQVAIEFTEPAAAVANVVACIRAGVPCVSGTTGWYDALPDVMREVEARNGALLWAPNFSAGVVLFTALVERAGELYGRDPSFDTHLIETHHSLKKDAPSGTALALAGVFRQAAGRAPELTSVRTGHVPGTHELILDAPFEQVRLTHSSRDRRVFADGALRGAAWLVGRRGVFTMRDVLGLPWEEALS